VHSAIASAHFSRAFPVRQVMVSERIMPGVTGVRWGSAVSPLAYVVLFRVLWFPFE
jgi:hypothetical protein